MVRIQKQEVTAQSNHNLPRSSNEARLRGGMIS